MQHVKCVIVGDGYVGKSAMVAGKEWPQGPTDMGNYSLEVTVDYKTYTIDMWDVGGTEDFDKIRRLSYPDTDVFLVCFTVHDPLIGTASFENISLKWIPEVKFYCPNVPFILVGTKIDLREDPDANEQWHQSKKHPITTKKGKLLAKKIGAVKYMECSAITQEGIASIFEEIIRTFLASSTSPQQPLNIIKYQQLQLLDVVGQGSFGAVFRGTWKTRKGGVVAVKKCTMTGTKRDPDIPREVQILSSVPEHPHIISFYGISLNYPDILIVTEFAENGSLFNYLHKEKQVPPVDQSLAWALQVAQGVEHLHIHDIIHRDLKSGNVLLSSSMRAKVCDFGTARYLLHTTMQTAVAGTARWMAPEVMEAVEANINKKCDSFSFGMVVYELLVHKVPYYDIPGDTVVGMKILQGERPSIPPNIPEFLNSLLTFCWETDPQKRPTFQDIIKELESDLC